MHQQPSATASAVPDAESVRPYLNFLFASTLIGKPSSAQMAIAAAIASEHLKNGRSQFTYSELARRAACTKRNAIRCVARLVASGFIRVIQQGAFGGNIYEPALERGEAHDRAWRGWAADWSKGLRNEFPHS
ncbi:hypothetical protein NKI88_09130 [Mesorhizobium sp. M0317]|uniref:hypothetical protein n=1 Tax=Mesorhizobium sp. M0317 TaxID=2956935 RepID=UPI00333566AF